MLISEYVQVAIAIAVPEEKKMWQSVPKILSNFILIKQLPYANMDSMDAIITQGIWVCGLMKAMD